MKDGHKFKGLANRLIVSTTILIAVFLLVFFAEYPLVRGIIFVLTFVLSIGALSEYHNLLKAKEINNSFLLICSSSLLLFITLYFISIKIFPYYILALVFAGIIYLLFLFQFGRIDGSLIAIATHLLAILYIVIPIMMLIAILYISSFNISGQDGRLWIIYLILTTKCVDIGGYFFGKLYGRKPLALALSPRKTVVGALSGFLCALIFSSFFWFILRLSSIEHFSVSFLDITILSAIIAFFSQIGDLAESLLKRDAQVKDSNKALPEVGGILDIVDSLIFTAPILFFYLIIR